MSWCLYIQNCEENTCSAAAVLLSHKRAASWSGVHVLASSFVVWFASLCVFCSEGPPLYCLRLDVWLLRQRSRRLADRCHFTSVTGWSGEGVCLFPLRQLCGNKGFGSTREALLSEAGFEKLSGPRTGSVGASCFVDDFVSCWGKRGAYRLLLEPSFKVAFNDVMSSGGLIVCCQKKAHQPFAALGDCLKNKTKEQGGSPPVENTVKQRRREGPGGEEVYVIHRVKCSK